MAVEVFMPKMSDHMESGEIIQWLVAEGDRVEQGQPIIELMTDKVSAELEAPATGILKGIRRGAGKGAEIAVGETIAYIAESGEEVPELPPIRGGVGDLAAGDAAVGAAAVDVSTGSDAGISAAISVETGHVAPAGPLDIDATPVAVKTAELHGIDIKSVSGSGPGGKIQKQDVLSYIEGSDGTGPPGRVKASPAARRRGRELGIDLSRVKGSGPRGILRESDVEGFHAQASVGIARAGAAAAESTVLELTSIQKITGERMSLSASTAPQFSLSLQVEVERLLCIRDIMMKAVEAESGRRLSITTLLIKIAAEALKRYPRANSSFDDGRILLYSEINVGVATGTEQGLVVPVVRGADHASVSQINAQMKVFEEKARSMRFGMEDLEGGHFTITNLGMYGIDRFNAIVNPPQSSILAVGRIINTPVATVEGAVALRKLMNLTLSVDHRCMDGVQGAQFLSVIRELVENPDIFVNGGGHAT
jgi:pyruvate dehydrogenase E2 component (dihydrolipoamide acetyltransferase)